MSKISIILFVTAVIISYEGFRIIFGLDTDIEGGPYFLAFIFGFPLFIIGMILGIIDIKRQNNELLIKNTKNKLGTPHFALFLNLFGVVFWLIHLISVNLE